MEDPGLSERQLRRLKKASNKLLNVDDEIRETRAMLKALTEEKKKREAKLVRLFQRMDIGEPVEITDTEGDVRASLRYAVSKRKNPLKADTIKEALVEIIPDRNRVDEVYAKIESRRGYREVPYIKRTKGTRR